MQNRVQAKTREEFTRDARTIGTRAADMGNIHSQGQGWPRLQPRTMCDVLVLESAHVLAFRLSLHSAALHWLFRLAGLGPSSLYFHVAIALPILPLPACLLLCLPCFLHLLSQSLSCRVFFASPLLHSPAARHYCRRVMLHHSSPRW
jgi:hypothetical protein